MNVASLALRARLGVALGCAVLASGFVAGCHPSEVAHDSSGRARGMALGAVVPTNTNLRVWTVAVGVSKYAEGTLDLRYANADATAVDAFFAGPGGGGIDAERRTLLVDERATRSAVLSALATTAKRSAPDDLLVIFLAMHGMADSGGDLYFLAHDTKPRELLGTGIAQRDVEYALSLAAAKRVVLLVDACHSGAAGFSMRGARALDETNRLVGKLAESRPGTAVLTAASATEFSLEDPKWGGGHGAFSHYLLLGLQGGADADRDGFVTVREAFDFVYARVPKDTDGQQHPELKGAFDNRLPLAQVPAATDPKPNPPACAVGETWNGKACVPSARFECPAGATWNGKACLVQTTQVACPEGTTWNGSACSAASAQCPPGSTWRGTRCVQEKVECPVGTTWSGSACLSGEARCGEGRVWTGTACATCSTLLAELEKAPERGTERADAATECEFTAYDAKLKREFDYETGHHRYGGTLDVVAKSFQAELVVAGTHDQALKSIETKYASRRWSVAIAVRRGSLFDGIRTGLLRTQPPALELFSDKEKKLLRMAEASSNEHTQSMGVEVREKRYDDWIGYRTRLLGEIDPATIQRYLAAVLVAGTREDVWRDRAMRRLYDLASSLEDAQLAAYTEGLVDANTQAPFVYRAGMFLTPEYFGKLPAEEQRRIREREAKEREAKERAGKEREAPEGRGRPAP